MRRHLRLTPVHLLLALVLALVGVVNTLAAAPTNDTIETATVISSLPFSETLDTREATTTDTDPACYRSNHTVWYQVTATANQRLQAEALGDNYDPTLCVYTGAPGALTMYAGTDDVNGALLQFDVVAGETYYILAGAYTVSPGGLLYFTLAVYAPPTSTPTPTPTPPPTPTPDQTPPTVRCGVNPTTISSKDHSLVTVTASVTVQDAQSGPNGFSLVSVMSSEADSGLARDDVANDIQGWVIGTPDVSGQLRAETYNARSPRVYTVTYLGKDMAGNSATCSATVTVKNSK